jgi:Na+-driven multidrug efflux pump
MNQAINFFWTILCMIPVVGFWIANGGLLWCCIFLVISFVSLLIPARILQLSNDPKFYKSAGVKLIRKFVQNGELINKYIRKNNPQYNLIKGRQNAAKYMQTVVMYERYHFLCLVFFMLTAGYAAMQRYYGFAALILIANIIYNLCPILLQQYNRARLLNLSR